MVGKVEAPVGFEPTNKGFADLPLRPLGYSAKSLKNKIHFRGFICYQRAGNGTRTRDINLGKVALYQLSYSRAQNSENNFISTWANIISSHYLCNNYLLYSFKKLTF